MGSRRGRLNWSNLEVRISDDAIDKQHRFTASASLSPTSISPEKTTEYEKESDPLVPPAPLTKRSWMPKEGVGEISPEEFVGNFMLTNAEQTAIDQKYNQRANHVECSKNLSVSKSIRISNRLPSMRDTPLSIRTTNLFVGQHLLNVFICHVESYSCVYIMFGDDYNRATKLFQDMNSCDELIGSSSVSFQGSSFAGYCSLSGLPATMSMSSIPEAVHADCLELLYKDRYEAIVTRLEPSNRPTIVLYYGNENVNDRLLTILKLL